MTVTLTLDDVRDLAHACLAASGADAANAAAVADTVTMAERDGCASHGLFRVPGYCAALKSGKVAGDAQPEVSELASAVLRVDNRRGFAPLAIRTALPHLVAKARDQGMAAAAIVDSHHFAALWPEVEALADEGLAGFAFTAGKSFVAPAGGSRPLYGTDPMAFAWPRDGAPPLVFDQASSAVARGEVMIAARDGHTLPEGVGIDADGAPSTDPAAVLAGAQLAFGGYKGASIALMVELLVGALIGQPFSFEATAADNGDGGPVTSGELILALDPARFGDAEGHLSHAEKLFAEVLAQPGTRLPGQRRFANRARDPHPGAEIPRSLLDSLNEIAGRDR